MEIYTAKQAADRLQVSYRKLLELLNEGELKGKRIGNEWRVTEQQIQDFLADTDN